MHDLNSRLCWAFGINPNTCAKLVITIEAGEYPKLEVTQYLTNNDKFYISTTDPSKIAQIQFMLRLEPFK